MPTSMDEGGKVLEVKSEAHVSIQFHQWMPTQKFNRFKAPCNLGFILYTSANQRVASSEKQQTFSGQNELLLVSQKVLENANSLYLCKEVHTT